jgi:pyridoxamine 5'-phosphate oxidase
LTEFLDDPFATFALWLDEARKTELNDPNAMTVATCTAEGRPSARIALLKEWDARGFVFYTNLESRKSEEIRQNPHVALLFHWKSLLRQIRIEGPVTQVTDAQADAYFAGRPRTSRLGAWASAQSRPLADRAIFEAKLAETEARFPEEATPRPPFWSGWRVEPENFEFWQDMPFRLHDRITFTRREAGRREAGRREAGWVKGRLYP